MTNRLALGTVQFGLDYGINNKRGQISYPEIEQILIAANKNGIKTLDTAEAYGNSELLLGKFSKENPEIKFEIISKYNFKGDVVSPSSFEKSLVNLSTDCLYGYMAHDFKKFNNDLELINNFTALKNEHVEKIGFSLYYPHDLEFLLQHKVKFDIVQLPYNIFDQRFDPYFETLNQLGIEIHTRSCFLQGLFFMEPENLPENLISLKNKLTYLKEKSTRSLISIQSLALVFCLSNKFISKVVIGVDNLLNLEDNIAAASASVDMSIINELKLLREDNERLILPLNW